MEAATRSRRQAVQEGTQSQVLQGFLSLLCVPVISVSVCPLAKGLMDVRGSLRVGQALLVPGEKAKPFGRGKETETEVSACPFLLHLPASFSPGTHRNKHPREQIHSPWGMQSAGF